MRVAVFATHPIQYQAPLWRRLAAQPDFKLHAFFGTDMSVRGYKDREFGITVTWDTPLLEGYTSSFLSTDSNIQQVSFRRPTARGLLKRLREFKPDVAVMTAYLSVFHISTWLTLRRLNVPIVMRHEASDVAHARRDWKAVARDIILRKFYARIDRFAVIGTESRKHLVRLGVPDSNMSASPYCVDSDFVAGQVLEWSPRRDSLRDEMGIAPNDIAFVFSGKLIPKKDPLLIVSALRQLISEGETAIVARIHVIIAGDGELREEIRSSLADLLGSRSHMLGFLNQKEIGRAYAISDALILPSKKGSGETWGLVVNEAMQYGLPVIVSDGVGCHRDMVTEAATGWVFPSGDSAGLCQALKKLADASDIARRQMRANARSMAELVSLDSAAQGLASAIRGLRRK